MKLNVNKKPTNPTEKHPPATKNRSSSHVSPFLLALQAAMVMVVLMPEKPDTP